MVGSTVSYFHKDHLGSSTVMTNASGTPVESTNFEPFGGQRAHTGTVTSAYKFTDQEFDAENGLYNYDARMYDPIIGRFISPDSILPDMYDPQALNRFTYCLNNPLIYTDPTGHVTGTHIYKPIDQANPTITIQFSSWRGGNVDHKWIENDHGAYVASFSLGVGVANVETYSKNNTDKSESSWYNRWHKEGREERNTNLPETLDEARQTDGAILLNQEMSQYHQDPSHEGPELKFIFDDGREAVYYSDTGKLVTDNRYKGTYNYVNPASPSLNPLRWPSIAIRGTGHFFVDMVPYYIWGN